MSLFILMRLLANICFVLPGSIMEDVRDLNKEVAPAEESMAELSVVKGRFTLVILLIVRSLIFALQKWGLSRR